MTVAGVLSGSVTRGAALDPQHGNIEYGALVRAVMIPLPQSITADQKKQIASFFDNLLEELDLSHQLKIHRFLPVTIDSLSGHNGTWLGDLAQHATEFYRAYQDEVSANGTGNTDVRRLLAAALYYIIECNDVIPDHRLSDGFLDDAYLVNLCIKKIEKIEPGYFGDALKPR